MISFVICSITPEKYSAVCENIGALMGSEPHEFIGIHDARSLSEGYNRGFERSAGEIVVFCHDDIEILASDFKDRLKKHLEQFDLVGVAGSDRFVGPTWSEAGPPNVYGQVAHVPKAGKGYELARWGVQARCIPDIVLLDGVFMAARRAVCEEVRFDEKVFDGFHLYDLDFSLRASLAGYRLAVCNDLKLLHYSKGDFEGEFNKYAAMFMIKHKAVAEPLTKEEKWIAWHSMKVIVLEKQGLLRQFECPHWLD